MPTVYNLKYNIVLKNKTGKCGARTRSFRSTFRMARRLTDSAMMDVIEIIQERLYNARQIRVHSIWASPDSNWASIRRVDYKLAARKMRNWDTLDS